MGKFEEFQPSERAKKAVEKFVSTSGKDIGRIKVDNPEAEALAREMADIEDLQRFDEQYNIENGGVASDNRLVGISNDQITKEGDWKASQRIGQEAMRDEKGNKEINSLKSNPQYREPGNKRSGYSEEFLGKVNNLENTIKANSMAASEEAKKYYEQVRADQDRLTEIRKKLNGTEVGELTEEKLSANVSYEDLENKISEVAAMKGVDQRSDFHDLTLDQHTKEVGRNLEDNDFIKNLDQRTRDLVFLAVKLHDLGKVAPEGQQIHPKNPEKRQYMGHEKVSEQLVREILPKHFSLSEKEIDFVAKLAGLHASALNLVNNFEKNNQPKGKDLGAYDSFYAKVDELPADLPLINKVKIILAINKADKLATFNSQSDQGSEKVKKIIESAEKQSKVIDELEKAAPALIAAIEAKRNGDQKSGIVFENGEYRYNNQ